MVTAIETLEKKRFIVLKNLRSQWCFFSSLIFAAFFLNLFWEIVQMPAYAAPARSWFSTVLEHVLPSLGDVAITLGIYGLAALSAGRLDWAATGEWNVFASAALLGGASATAYEWKALGEGWWSYSELMPVVPVLGVGLWPLLQLTLLAPSALWVAVWWGRVR